MVFNFERRIVAAAIVGLLALPGSALAIGDASGDFVSTFTGTHGADLDVISANSWQDGTYIYVSATMAGNVGTTSNAAYVWGFNRGAGTARFGATYSGVVFDSVVTLNPNGTGSGRDLVSSTTFGVNASDISISGATIQGKFLASSLVSRGLTLSNYTWNLWPRLQSISGVAGISDFAPDNSMAQVAATPEPATMCLLGIGTIAALRRRKK